MYSLSEGLRILIGEEALFEEEPKVYCTETTPSLTLRANLLQDTMAFYTFTLVRRGWLTIDYNNQKFTLTKNDLYPYAPGMPLRIIAASPNYRGICLLADETFTLRSSNMHNAIRAAYFPLVELTEPKLQLNSDDAAHLSDLMQLAIHYLTAPHPQRDESLRLLYNLFLNDLTATQERSISQHRFPKRVEEIYLDFLRLLSQNYAEHRDIAFYAAELSITTTYLSRIVRQVSSRTVMEYIDQMLLMEASWLLQTTTLSVSQIADRLHFAETASFARFFRRMKGCTPKEYRNIHAATNLYDNRIATD
jgi:AraC-like DNA-binding protein